jgi:CMP/dCMP kinase
MTSTIPVISIDGPSGTGKGTIAHLLAAKLGWNILDSGVLYRLVALGIEKQKTDATDISTISEFARRMEVQFKVRAEASPENQEAIVLNGEDVSALVRLEETGEKASLVAAIPEVREALYERQQNFRQSPGLVADGRDMGTVVFPDAQLKIFLTASPEERARRRYKQLINKGLSVNLRALLSEIEARDERDSSRSISPLIPADDAIVIDTTSLGIAQVLEKVLGMALKIIP